jgi:riboflavin kinase/FMN adenylyltransferase
MNIYNDIELFPTSIGPVVMTIGTFDGVHKAHSVIINEILRLAPLYNGESLVVSFPDPPRKLLLPNLQTKILTTPEEKSRLLQQTGIKHLLYLNFTPEIAAMNYREFIQFLADKMQIQIIVAGYNHFFGKNRVGAIHNLKKWGAVCGFEVVKIEKQKVNAFPISSSTIRKALDKGNLTVANCLLGYGYELHVSLLSCQADQCIAQVIHPDKLLPKDGTYPVVIGQENVIVKIKDKRLYIPMAEKLSATKDESSFCVKFLDNV